MLVCSIVAAGILLALIWIAMLRRRVTEQTRVIRDSEARFRHMAQHDELTGVPNRALLYDRMQMVLAGSARSETKIGLLMVDLDGFKEINDKLGHDAGNTVLREVANRLTCAVRNADTVARVGGDEFIILAPGLKTEIDIEQVAAKIVTIVSAPIEVGTRSVVVSASVGACTFPYGGEDIDTLLKSADVAMYKAKAQGKNRYYVFRQETCASGMREEHTGQRQ